MRPEDWPTRRVTRLGVNEWGVPVNLLRCGHTFYGRLGAVGEHRPCRRCAGEDVFADRAGLQPTRVDGVTCQNCRIVSPVGARVCLQCGAMLGWTVAGA